MTANETGKKMPNCALKALITAAGGTGGLAFLQWIKDATDVIQFFIAVGVFAGTYLGLYWAVKERRKRKGRR